MNVFRMIYFCIVHFAYAVTKWSTILNITILFLLLGVATVPVFGTVIVPLASM